MRKKERITRYEPPFAKDISLIVAKGQFSPEGVCKTGTAPFYTCITGPGVLPLCGPGGSPDTSACGPGGYHTWPACSPGTNAATICGSGQGQQ
ncbi:MAG: hypothetical protein JXI33_01485 [Candidatus Aminicenantes bacterium]|nr:hypothetical protein [Candidatus Aminicenantes bacterium]